MANYSLVINSKFRPFEYQELLAPVLMATQAHQAVEEAYADLSTKANIWDKMANEITDPKAHAMYKKYADDLQSYSDQLAQHGLTPTSRQAMLNMRSRYAKDIVPIETAYKKREAQAAAQQQALMSNPSLLFSRRAADTSLDAYIANPDLNYEVYSGALLEKQVSDAAAALAKTARSDPRVQKTIKNKLAPYQWELIRQSGFDPETVRATIMGTEGGNKILSDIVEGAITASNIDKWAFASDADKKAVLDTARAYASRGLWSAVGETKYDKIVDTYGMQAALQRERPSGKTENTAEGNPLYRRIANTKVQGDTKQLQDDLQFLQNLSKTGISSLSRKKGESKLGPVTSAYMRRTTGSYSKNLQASTPSDYDKAIGRYKTIAKKYGIDVNAWGPNVNKTLIDKLSKDIERNIVRSSTYQVNMTDQSQLAKILEENSNTMSISNRNRSGLKVIDDKGRVGGYIDAETAGEIFGKGNNFNLSYSPDRGFQLSYRDKDNKFATVQVDPELLNFGDDDYTKGHGYVKQYINSGDYRNASSLIDAMMNGLYYRFNTQGIKQSQSGEIK